MRVDQEYEEVSIELNSVVTAVDEFAFKGEGFVGERGDIAREAVFPSEGAQVKLGLPPYRAVTEMRWQ